MTKKECTKKCEKPCAQKCAKDVKKVDVGEIKNKVSDVAKKIPQWVERAKKELEKLIEKLNKLDETLAKILKAFGGGVTWENVRKVRGTRNEIRMVQLLMKQREAMCAYKAALEERIKLGEGGSSLKI